MCVVRLALVFAERGVDAVIVVIVVDVVAGVGVAVAVAVKRRRRAPTSADDAEGCGVCPCGSCGLRRVFAATMCGWARVSHQVCVCGVVRDGDVGNGEP